MSARICSCVVPVSCILSSSPSHLTPPVYLVLYVALTCYIDGFAQLSLDLRLKMHVKFPCNFAW